MFPRCSLLYRFIAVCLLLSIFMMVLNTRSDVTTHKRLPYHHEYSVRDLQDAKMEVIRETVRKTVRSYHNINRSTTAKPIPVAVTIPIITDPAINPHDFNFVCNPTTMCNHTGIKYVIYVHSAPKNFKKRQMVRQTWGSKAILTKYNMRLVFVMGQVSNRNVIEIIMLEQEQYGDLVVEDFVDSYRNLTYKAIAALKWVSTYCANAEYVIKSDDDILIDMHALMQYMNSSTVKEYGTKNLIMCNQWLRMKVIRDKKSKWYISKKEFPSDFFPPYCSGSAFVMSGDVVAEMYKASLDTEFFWVDDFYVTGLLVKKIKINHKRLNDGYILNARVALDKLKEDKQHKLKFFHVNKLTNIYKMWSILKERKNTTCEEDCFTWSPAA